MPRKIAVPVHPFPRVARFNEAGAEMPRKISHEVKPCAAILELQ